MNPDGDGARSTLELLLVNFRFGQSNAVMQGLPDSAAAMAVLVAVCERMTAGLERDQLAELGKLAGYQASEATDSADTFILDVGAALIPIEATKSGASDEVRSQAVHFWTEFTPRLIAQGTNSNAFRGAVDAPAESTPAAAEPPLVRGSTAALLNEELRYDYERQPQRALVRPDGAAGTQLPAWATEAEKAAGDFTDVTSLFRSTEWRCTMLRERPFPPPLPQIDVDTPFRQLLQLAIAQRSERQEVVIADLVSLVDEGVRLNVYFPYGQKLDLKDWDVILDPDGRALRPTSHTFEVKGDEPSANAPSYFHFAVYDFADWQYYERDSFAPTQLIVARGPDGIWGEIRYDLPSAAR